jgi:hypothetical protein
MFGNNVTSSWANPQQNQQPQQNPPAFGQTGAFGTAGMLIIFFDPSHFPALSDL